MEGIGPDQAGKEELKRAETWRAIRRELSLGVKPQWTGKSTSNTRLFKASLEQKLAQKIVEHALHRFLLGRACAPPGSAGERDAGVKRCCYVVLAIKRSQVS